VGDSVWLRVGAGLVVVEVLGAVEAIVVMVVCEGWVMLR